MDAFPLFNVNGSIGSGAYDVPDYPTAEDFIKHLDYLGIDRSLVWHIEARDLNPALGNKFLLEEILKSGLQDRLIPAFIITPACFFEYGTMGFLRESFESGKVKAHYGAAIAMLANAKINEEQRRLIAHGNIERLLQLPPLTEKIAVESPILKEKPLWCKFKSGKAIDDIKIIDAHGHDGPHTRGWFLRDSTIAKIVEQMDRDFYVGFKLLASYWKIPLTDPVYSPVWEYADKHKLPILLHTWADGFSSPEMLKDIVKQYPNAFFLLGHSGGSSYGRIQAEKLALDNYNVFLEFCGSFTTPIPFEESAEKVGWDKVVFGSDTGAHSESWELGRYLSMPVPDEVLTPGLAGNMLRILEACKG